MAGGEGLPSSSDTLLSVIGGGEFLAALDVKPIYSFDNRSGNYCSLLDRTCATVKRHPVAIKSRTTLSLCHLVAPPALYRLYE